MSLIPIGTSSRPALCRNRSAPHAHGGLKVPPSMVARAWARAKMAYGITATKPWPAHTLMAKSQLQVALLQQAPPGLPLLDTQDLASETAWFAFGTTNLALTLGSGLRGLGALAQRGLLPGEGHVDEREALRARLALLPARARRRRPHRRTFGTPGCPCAHCYGRGCLGAADRGAKREHGCSGELHPRSFCTSAVMVHPQHRASVVRLSL